MLPSLQVLENDLKDYGHAELIVKAGSIVDLGKAHPLLQNVPEDVPGPDDIHKLNVDFAASVQAALDGGKKAIEDRDLKRLHLLEAVYMWGQHIVMRYKRRKDPAVLENNGFDLKKQVSKASKIKVGATPVPEFRLKHGATEHLNVVLKQIPGRGTFEVRFSTDPNDEAAWVDAGHHTYCNIELGSFVPGTRYYFSVRYHGPYGTSAWSAPMNIIAL